MTIHPVRSVHALSPVVRRDSTRDSTDAVAGPETASPETANTDTASTDTTGTAGTAYDSTWATTQTTPDAPSQSSGFEEMMVSGGKIYVVLAVVLIIWFGLATFLFRTDRKIDRLEDKLDADSNAG